MNEIEGLLFVCFFALVQGPKPLQWEVKGGVGSGEDGLQRVDNVKILKRK